MTLVLSNDDAAAVLTMSSTIEALERLYANLGTGSAVYRGRTDLFAPTVAKVEEPIPAAHQFKTLDGAIPRLQAASIRVTSDVVAFPLVDGRRRRIKLPAAEGGSYVGLVFLFSSATGELVAVLQDGLLQRYSVGAINAIGAKYLSRPEASRVGLIGAGNQAGPQLEALNGWSPECTSAACSGTSRWTTASRRPTSSCSTPARRSTSTSPPTSGRWSGSTTS